MAPYSDFLGLDKLTAKEKNKLRKPVVEKMRRDRINSSIEQLKLLLEREFQGQQPNTKLEKADVLEMAVSYLQVHGRPQIGTVASLHKEDTQGDFKEGYSRCFKEALHFLSFHEVHTETQAKLLSHFQMNKATSPVPDLPCPPPTHKSPKPTAAVGSSNLWRPW
ncbi:transcription factor HES-5 [Microcaecilia unicolor]|uniref:Transcription factor HES-5 n=1 Tax=Microcaecilia unicolor TaxID=1415580 RepID=A0A6P7WN12_9AMPH|nr:transcription factor HES-5-like [Microcaecilia unicolor]